MPEFRKKNDKDGLIILRVKVDADRMSDQEEMVVATVLNEQRSTSHDYLAFLGARLRSQRLKLGLPQGVAIECGISGSYLSRFEHGKRRPTFTMLATLTRRYGIPLMPLLAEAARVVAPEEEVPFGIEDTVIWALLHFERAEGVE